MSQIAIISDTHWGARGDRSALLDYQVKFYRDIFFPELEKRKIQTVWHLGDLVDRRKFINYRTLEVMKTEFLDRLEGNYDTHIIMGNHDMYYKNIVSPNALGELIKSYETIQTYETPQEYTLPNGDTVCVIPWIVDETREAAYDLLKNSKAKYCFGHLQIKSFEMERGHICDDGDDANLYRRFDLTLSGHFHHKSQKDNICYVGATNEMTWRDYKDNRGFHFLDLDTLELEHVYNHHRLFRKIRYNDEGVDANVLLREIHDQLEDAEGSFIKLIVNTKRDNYLFDRVTDEIMESSPADLQIVDDHFNLNVETDDVILEQAEDTLTILNKYIQKQKVRCDEEALKKLLKELYDEAAFLRLS